MKGIVKFFSEERNYGFIHTTDEDYFFNRSDWALPNLPVKGQWVSFDYEDRPRGKKALEVKPVVDN